MEIQRCRRCVLPVSAVKMNPEGVCHLCASYDEIIDWPKLESNFREIADGFKKQGRQYDCMVPLTGGKDSSFVLHYTRNICGLTPLAFTWDNAMIREGAWRNIRTALKRLGIDHEVVRFDPDFWRRTLRATFRKIEKVCFCPIFMLYTAIPVAVRHAVPAIITGFSEGQRGLDHSFRVPDKEKNLENIKRFHRVWWAVFKECIAYYEDEETTSHILDHFFGPLDRCLKEHTNPADYPVIIPLSNYVSWLRRDELEPTLRKNLDWEKAADSFVHTSCFIEPIKGYLEYTGQMNEIHHELSYLVRGGFMKREEAMHDLGAMNVHDREPAVVDQFTEFLSISKDEFRSIVDRGPQVKFLVDGVDGGRITPKEILGTVAWCMGNREQIVDYSPKSRSTAGGK